MQWLTQSKAHDEVPVKQSPSVKIIRGRDSRECEPTPVTEDNEPNGFPPAYDNDGNGEDVN
jgi:hypothetical protein